MNRPAPLDGFPLARHRPAAARLPVAAQRIVTIAAIGEAVAAAP